LTSGFKRQLIIYMREIFNPYLNLRVVLAVQQIEANEVERFNTQLQQFIAQRKVVKHGACPKKAARTGRKIEFTVNFFLLRFS
jgi:hypothetical protein